MLKKLKQLSTAKKIVIAFGLLIFLLFSPLVSFIFNFGSAVGMGMGLTVILISIFFEKIKSFIKSAWGRKLGKVIICTVCVIALTAALYCCVVSVNVLT